MEFDAVARHEVAALKLPLSPRGLRRQYACDGEKDREKDTVPFHIALLLLVSWLCVRERAIQWFFIFRLANDRKGLLTCRKGLLTCRSPDQCICLSCRKNRRSYETGCIFSRILRNDHSPDLD